MNPRILILILTLFTLSLTPVHAEQRVFAVNPYSADEMAPVNHLLAQGWRVVLATAACGDYNNLRLNLCLVLESPPVVSTKM